MAKRSKKKKSYITHPHDLFFKGQLGVKKHAKCFVKEVMPSDLLKLIDLDSLELKNGTYVDENLQEYFSDLLYEVEFSGEKRGFIYFLIEHKSGRDRFSSLQMLKYMVQIWDSCIKNSKGVKKLPVIIPCLFYQGKHEWPYGKSFENLFELIPEYSAYIPKFDFTFFNLREYQGEFIDSSVELHVMVYLMKHIFDDDFSRRYKIALNFIKKVPEKGRSLFLSTVLSYILGAQKQLGVYELIDLTEDALSKEEGETAMSIARQLYNDGIKQGIEQGIEKEKKSSVLTLLEVKFGKEGLFLKDKIEAITDISKLDEIVELIKADSDIDNIVKFIDKL